MPKRKTYNFKSLQGSSSSSSSNTPQNGNDPATLSVNERLHDLRKLEAKDAEARKRQLAESVNQRSVPPDVRGILGFPETAPPKPKAHAIRMMMRERRRTPGPAPPRSWMKDASTTSASWTKANQAANTSLRSKPRHLLRFARLSGLEEDDAAEKKPPSLIHLTLKSLADAWDLLDEEDYPILADVPLRLRLRLLSYISFNGSSLTVAGLQALLQGSERISSLDLAGLVGHRNLTLKTIRKSLSPTTTHSSPPETTIINDSSIIESWDLDESLEATLTISTLTPTNRFSSLTHLCLSHPGSLTSWRELLALCKVTPQVTHLSLAYWPRPTLTPNLSTTTVSSRHGEITAGGSHYYSTIDQDLSEPASLLRQLSHNLLCLQWLDIEGCEEWTPALGKLASGGDEATRNDRDGWVSTSSSVERSDLTSTFTSTWKNLNHIHCPQGWLPSYEGIRGLAERTQSTVIDVLIIEGLTKYLIANAEPDGLGMKSSFEQATETERKKARIWLDSEYGATYACMQINSARRAQGLRPVEVDFGWITRHSSTLK